MTNPVLRAFTCQKAAAKQRGILFDFDINGWCEWWERELGPDWFSVRGTNSSGHVMGRIGDVGPYADYNVKAVTMAENVREQHRIRKHRENRHCKLSRGSATDSPR